MRYYMHMFHKCMKYEETKQITFIKEYAVHEDFY